MHTKVKIDSPKSSNEPHDNHHKKPQPTHTDPITQPDAVANTSPTGEDPNTTPSPKTGHGGHKKATAEKPAH
eukprot:8453861-Prorocentrum_lima.AAC.1